MARIGCYQDRGRRASMIAGGNMGVIACNLIGNWLNQTILQQYYIRRQLLRDSWQSWQRPRVRAAADVGEAFQRTRSDCYTTAHDEQMSQMSQISHILDLQGGDTNVSVRCAPSSLIYINDVHSEGVRFQPSARRELQHQQRSHLFVTLICMPLTLSAAL